MFAKSTGPALSHGPGPGRGPTTLARRPAHSGSADPRVGTAVARHPAPPAPDRSGGDQRPDVGLASPAGSSDSRAAAPGGLPRIVAAPTRPFAGRAQRYP